MADQEKVWAAFLADIDDSNPSSSAFNFGTITTADMNNRDLSNPVEDGMDYADLLQLDSVNLRRLTPFQPGRGYFVPVEMPAFMEDVFPNETRFFENLLTVYATGVDGIQNPTLNFDEVTSGVENQTMEIASGRGGRTDEVTFRFPADFRGQFITKYLSLWMDGVLDPNTDRGHYHGSDLVYTNAHHTMSGVYFTLDPSERRVEFACYMFNMMPKEAQLSINNKTKGENAPEELNPAFTTQMIYGNDKITKLAYQYLEQITANTNGTTAFRDDILESYDTESVDI